MITLERINCDPLLAEAGLAVCCTETFCTLMEQGAFRSANCRRVLAALYDAEPDAADPYRVRLPRGKGTDEIAQAEKRFSGSLAYLLAQQREQQRLPVGFLYHQVVAVGVGFAEPHHGARLVTGI